MTTESSSCFSDKYRPQQLSDFCFPKQLDDMLHILLQTNKLTFLLVGQSGCGKTTLLNVMVKEYYKDVSTQSIEDNVMVINNLKEQGINFFRSDVKTFCQSRCTIRGKKKMVVLDDLDFINEQCQQIFRNYIDKFGNNVQFMMSCTNLQKVLESVQSRLLPIEMQRTHDLEAQLQKIAKQEGIVFDGADTEKFVVLISNGMIKNLINYLEKFKLVDKMVTRELAEKLCTDICFHVFETYTALLKQNRLNDAIDVLYEVHDKGYSVMDILTNYFTFVKMVGGDALTEAEKYELVSIICRYITIFHNLHEDEIELAFFSNNCLNALTATRN